RRWRTSSTRSRLPAGPGSAPTKSRTRAPGARSRRSGSGRPGSGRLRELRASRGANAVEENLNQPRPAPGAGGGGLLGDGADAAADHRDVLPLDVLADGT